MPLLSLRLVLGDCFSLLFLLLFLVFWLLLLMHVMSSLLSYQKGLKRFALFLSCPSLPPLPPLPLLNRRNSQISILPPSLPPSLQHPHRLLLQHPQHLGHRAGSGGRGGREGGRGTVFSSFINGTEPVFVGFGRRPFVCVWKHLTLYHARSRRQAFSSPDLLDA